MNIQLDDEKTDYIESTMKRFKLIDMKEQYLDIINEAKQEKLSYFDFLLKLLKVEDEGKTKRRQMLLINKASFNKCIIYYSFLSEIQI